MPSTQLPFRARFLALAVLAGVAVVLPVASAGCGRTACVVYSQSEYEARGTCPLQKDALPYFTSAQCPGPVVSIDGEGVFDLNDTTPSESLCCYPVTQQDVELDEDRQDCLPAGTGGTFGSATVVPGFGGQGGGGGGCFTCEEVVTGSPGAAPALLCAGPDAAWSALQACICDAASGCAGECELNLCENVGPTIECRACFEGTSTCADQLLECEFQ